jgi:hypothetical protein
VARNISASVALRILLVIIVSIGTRPFHQGRSSSIICDLGSYEVAGGTTRASAASATGYFKAPCSCGPAETSSVECTGPRSRIRESDVDHLAHPKPSFLRAAWLGILHSNSKRGRSVWRHQQHFHNLQREWWDGRPHDVSAARPARATAPTTAIAANRTTVTARPVHYRGLSPQLHRSLCRC